MSYSRNRKYKKLDGKQEREVVKVVKRILHAGRDTLRNWDKDTTKINWDCTEGHYSEAFGVFRGLSILGYGDFGDDIYPHTVYDKWNLKWWFNQIKDKVLKEENFGGSNECDYCLKQWGKDGSGRKS